MSDPGTETDKKAGAHVHRRAQLDHAIHSARLQGFVEKLVEGVITADEVVAVLADVNRSTDQSRYIAETLAMKKELRGLVRQEFHSEVARFLSEAAKLIPELSDGLASQVMMVLGQASQNDAYLDTISNAVSVLLSDLDRPLSREARSYLRLLWDQLESTRGLNQPEVGEPARRSATSDVGRSPQAIPASPEPQGAVPDSSLGKSTTPEAVDTTVAAESAPAAEAPADAAPVIAIQGESERISDPPGDLEHRPAWAATLSTDAVRHSVSPGRPRASERANQGIMQVVSSTKTIIGGVAASDTLSPDGSSDTGAPDHTELMSAVDDESGVHSSQGGVPDDKANWDPETSDFFAAKPTSEPPPSSTAALSQRPSVTPPPRPWRKDPNVQLPTNTVPKWAVAVAGLTVCAGIGAFIYLTREVEPEPQGPAALGSGAAAAVGSGPHASAAHSGTRAAVSAPAPQQPAPPPPPPPPPAANEEPVPAPPNHAAAVKAHAAKAAAVAAPTRVATDNNPVTPRTPAAHPSDAQSKPQVTGTGTGAGAHSGHTEVVTPPDVAKSMSPLDRIVAELRIISPDPVGIEEKARELSRIIANSKRKDAFYILDHLGPQLAIDPLGRNPDLEESLRVFAISTLGRVALDDDDARAASAIFMLGEWAKSGGKGRQKALVALDSLGKENLIKASAPRAKALRAVKAQLEQ